MSIGAAMWRPIVEAWNRWMVSGTTRRQRTAMLARPSLPRSEFVACFPRSEREAEVVFDALRAQIFVEGFSPHPDDNLDRIYELAFEELEDFVLDAFKSLGYLVPSPKDTVELPPVKSVRDAVQFLSRFRSGTGFPAVTVSGFPHIGGRQAIDARTAQRSRDARAIRFRAIAELDLGPDASARMTPALEQALVGDLVAASPFVLILGGGVGSPGDGPPALRRVESGQGLAPRDSANLFTMARQGGRAVFVFSSTDEALRVLGTHGFEPCPTSSGSEGFVRGWEQWLERHVPDADAAVVLGHDLEPAFVFGRVETGA